ncbi:MAG: nitric oxide reductase activation protein [Burkholderiales bacterium]|nr:nitric oxide reductase activation protein [Burkholderiales bacterium]
MRAADVLYTQAELEERLDDILCAALSSRRSAAAIAAGIAPLPRAQQEFVLGWAQVAAHNVAELGYQFTAQAPQALALFGRGGTEKWLLHALDAYDKEGLYPACAALKDLAGFKRRTDAAGEGVALTEVTRVLELFLRGLAGRRLQLEAADDTWTDTETIFLPERIACYTSREQNFSLYKAIAVHHWSQARYGSFNVELGPALAAYAEPGRALAWLNLLEAIRLESLVGRSYAGLAALLAALRPELPARLVAARERLSQADSSIADSVLLLPEFYPLPLPEPFPYMGSLHPQRAAEVRGERIAKERRALYTELEQLRQTAQAERNESQAGEPELDVDSSFDTLEFELQIDGEEVTPPEEVAKLIRSIIQDFGEIPEEYLLASGPGAYAAEDPSADEAASEVGESQAVGGRLYDEWDFRRRDYRKDWCVLFESDVLPGDPGYVAAVRVRYAGRIAQLRRRFEALRGEDRLLRRQTEGEDIDFDAAVEAYADCKSGVEPSERLFVQRQRTERNIAVMFMVDMSGSTKGWINTCEREALVLLCEALEALGDRYAIYGFSGWTRKRCEIYRIKTFGESYSEAVRGRIAGVEPRDYTRMGVAIRHLSGILNEVEAKTRILFTLSDGKPDDFHDGYRGDYGIEDTRQALLEARQSGIHPFCVTIDEEARDYLPHMYGPASWVLIDDAGQLPLKTADVYRRLTS